MRDIVNSDLWEGLRMAGDGYDRMEEATKFGYRAISAWGLDGWDLGDWPYVMVFFRETATEREAEVSKYEVVVNVEGDTTITEFDSREEREAWVDGWALREWQYHKPDWFEEVYQTRPDDLKGAFSWKRLERSKEQEAVHAKQ